MVICSYLELIGPWGEFNFWNCYPRGARGHDCSHGMENIQLSVSNLIESKSSVNWENVTEGYTN